jgi:hypothetical protein
VARHRPGASALGLGRQRLVPPHQGLAVAVATVISVDTAAPNEGTGRRQCP